jgi:SAM-dependent methyltransferase
MTKQRAAAPRPVGPAAFFDAIARRYDRAYALDGAATRARMGRVLAELAPRSRVLVLGVGTGRELSSLQDAGHSPVGLDVSREMLAICARRARPVPLVEGDLWATLPFDDSSFDAALALHAALAHPTHAGAHRALAKELARVLRAGGALVAEMPSRAWLDALGDVGGDGIVAGDHAVRKIAPDRCVHDDRAASVSVEAVIPSDEEWRAAFAGFDVTFEAMGASETLVVARRAK